MTDLERRIYDSISEIPANNPMVMSVYNDTLRSLLSDELLREIAKRAASIAEQNVTIGVGDGRGNLFVHGSYDSIKAVQAIIDERDQLRTKKRPIAWRVKVKGNWIYLEREEVAYHMSKYYDGEMQGLFVREEHERHS